LNSCSASAINIYSSQWGGGGFRGYCNNSSGCNGRVVYSSVGCGSSSGSCRRGSVVCSCVDSVRGSGRGVRGVTSQTNYLPFIFPNTTVST